MEDNEETKTDHGARSTMDDGKGSLRHLHSPGDENTQATEAEKEAHEYISGPKLWLVTAAVTLVMFLTLLDTTIIVTAIPRITTDFSSLADVGWYGSAYLIASCALQPLTGKIYSQLSLKYTFLAFLVLFEIGSAICGAAQSSKMLIIGRAVAGLGGSGLRNGALNIITESIPLSKRPPYFGVMMGLSLCGAAVGPLLGGVFTKYVSWRWCFYINLPVGAAAAILLLAIRIPDAKEKKPRNSSALSALSTLDLVGFFLFAPCAVMFLMALEWGGSNYAWGSATIIGLLCGAGGLLIVFLGWEYRVGDEAMIPFSMVRRRAVWSSCLVIWFFFGAMMVYSYYLPIYFQAVKGASPLASGVDVLPLIISQMIASILAGGLVGKVGYYIPFSVASGILMAISAGLISSFKVDTSTGKWIGYQVIGGLGQGLGMQMPYIAIQNAIPQEHNAVALALIVFMQNLGGAIFLALAQTIFTTDLRVGLAKFAPTVDAETVEAAGATGFRAVVAPVQVIGVLEAYNSAVAKNFLLAVGCAAATLLCCWGMGWVNIKKKEEEKSESVEMTSN